MLDIITISYAKARQQNPTIEQMTLHKWLTMVDLLGCLQNQTEVTPDLWNSMLQLFSLQ